MDTREKKLRSIIEANRRWNLIYRSKCIRSGIPIDEVALRPVTEFGIVFTSYINAIRRFKGDNDEDSR